MHPNASQWVRMDPKASKNLRKLRKTSRKHRKIFILILIWALFFSKKFENVRTLPNASECVRMHPNGSEWIRMGPNTPESLEKTYENFEKLRKTFEKVDFNHDMATYMGISHVGLANNIKEDLRLAGGVFVFWVLGLSPKQVVGFSCLFNSELTN